MMLYSAVYISNYFLVEGGCFKPIHLSLSLQRIEINVQHQLGLLVWCINRRIVVRLGYSCGDGVRLISYPESVCVLLFFSHGSTSSFYFSRSQNAYLHLSFFLSLSSPHLQTGSHLFLFLSLSLSLVIHSIKTEKFREKSKKMKIQPVIQHMSISDVLSSPLSSSSCYCVR